MKTKVLRDDFFTGYLVCALWSSCDENDEPLDNDTSIIDLPFTTLLALARDCWDFKRSNAELLERYSEELGSNGEYSAMERAGHAFWLTRNGHGAGFWDRGLGELGKQLTQASKVYGSVYLYRGDDGKVYAC